MRYLIALLWLIIFTKKLFFWVYLWQLKEYHIGRFIDHFSTYKGKKLIFNYLLLVKILALLGMIFAARRGWTEIKFDLVYFTAFIFLAETLLAIKSFWQKTFKRPVLTQKTAVVLSTGLSFSVSPGIQTDKIYRGFIVARYFNSCRFFFFGFGFSANSRYFEKSSYSKG